MLLPGALCLSTEHAPHVPIRRSLGRCAKSRQTRPILPRSEGEAGSPVHKISSERSLGRRAVLLQVGLILAPPRGNWWLGAQKAVADAPKEGLVATSTRRRLAATATAASTAPDPRPRCARIPKPMAPAVTAVRQVRQARCMAPRSLAPSVSTAAALAHNLSPFSRSRSSGRRPPAAIGVGSYRASTDGRGVKKSRVRPGGGLALRASIGQAMKRKIDSCPRKLTPGRRGGAGCGLHNG